jgi:perosamine synthetase
MLNYEAAGTKNTYWMVTAIIDKSYGIEKESLMAWMNARNISCRPFFYPLSSLPAYENFEQVQQARWRNQVSYQISPYGVNLPSGLNMTEEKVLYVCDALKALLRQGGQ